MKRIMTHTAALIILTLLLVIGMGGAEVFAATGDVVIDFESATPGAFIHMEEDGYNIDWIGYGDYSNIGMDGSGNHFLQDPNLDMSGSEVIITESNGASFEFRSLDYNNSNNEYPYHVIAVRALDTNGIPHYLELLPVSSTYSTLTAAQLGVAGIPINELRINLVSVIADYTVDNIVLSDETPPVFTEIDGQVYDGTNPINLGYIATGFHKIISYKAEDHGSGFEGGLTELTGNLDIPTGTPSFETLSEPLTIYDLAGNSASVTFQYKVINLSDMVNLLEPIQDRTTFKLGSTMPVKLQLMVDTNDDGVLEPQQMSAEDLTFALQLSKGTTLVTPTRTNHVEGLNDAEFTLIGPNYDTYQFNLNTKGLTRDDYTLKIYILDKFGTDEGMVGVVNFTLK